MSGIYIPNWEKPESCDDCWAEYAYEICNSHSDSCPLISVPDHGRLIDADALHEHMVKVHNEWKEHPELHESIVPVVDDEVMVLYFPTIIPADKDGET